MQDYGLCSLNSVTFTMFSNHWQLADVFLGSIESLCLCSWCYFLCLVYGFEKKYLLLNNVFLPLQMQFSPNFWSNGMQWSAWYKDKLKEKVTRKWRWSLLQQFFSGRSYRRPFWKGSFMATNFHIFPPYFCVKKMEISCFFCKLQACLLSCSFKTSLVFYGFTESQPIYYLWLCWKQLEKAQLYKSSTWRF